MNRRQSNQDKRNQKVVAVADAHPDELATVPAVAEAVAELRRRMGLVQPAVRQQLQSRRGKGATKTKNNLEAPLIKQVVKAANALSLLYKKTGRLDMALALHLRASDYGKMTEPDLAAEAQDVADQVKEQLAALAPYGYKAGDDVTLAAQVAAYDTSIPGARTVGGRGKVGTGAVRTVFNDLGTFVTGDFRSAVELLVDEHPELYALLREAMRIDDTGGGKKGKGGEQPLPPTTPQA